MKLYRAKQEQTLRNYDTKAGGSRQSLLSFLGRHRISLALSVIFVMAFSASLIPLWQAKIAVTPPNVPQTGTQPPQVIHTFTGLSSTSTIADSFLAAAASASQQAAASGGTSGSSSKAKAKTSTTPTTPAPTPPPAAPSSSFPTHSNIMTTVFWVGEPATAENGYIQNSDSTWDEDWEEHFGGFDNPNSRNGYLPSGFTPHENPFYFALPYSDLNDNGNRRTSANSCPEAAAKQGQNTSWCKNSWISITNGSKTCYAQWEDAGPYGENDTAYVFGSSAPANHNDTGAGLDVSPAARDCLGMGDTARTSWHFVTAASVPAGPWKNIITTTPSYTVD